MTVETIYTSTTTGNIDSGHSSSKTGCSPRESLPSPRHPDVFRKSAMTVHHEESGPSSPRSKKFTVYLNGVPGIGQEVTIELDQVSDWNDFVLELDSSITFSAPTNEVFSINGELLHSIEGALGQETLVVGSGQPFIPLQYKSLPGIHPSGGGGDGGLSKSIQLRKSPAGNARKFMRNGLTKSVYAIDESFQGSSSSNNELNSLLKTMSEEQVCFREVQTIHDHSRLPNSVIRQSVHAKPRPVSCYGAPNSIYSNDGTSAFKKSPGSSRIPKRISVIPSTNQDLKSNLSSNTLITSLQTSSPVKVPSTNTKLTPNPKLITQKLAVVPKEKSSRQELNAKRDFILPRIVSIIRTGTKPRKVIRYLLNQKTARSFEQVLSDMTERLQAPWGAIRKVFTLGGHPVESLEDFFKEERIFLACPNDRHVPEDFVLESDEIKAIPNYLKLYPGAVKAKSSEAPRTPQKRAKSQSPRVNQRTPPSSYPTHPKYLAVSQLPNFILDKYFVGDIIGDGNFAVVRECIDRYSGAQYALKVIDKTKSGLDAPADHEVKILKSVSHPNIIHLFEDFAYEDELFVIMEHVSGGDLFDTIAQCIKFSEEESASFTKDIASAISFLHARGIVHRDIKPENLLVYLERDRKRRIKVGDFGLAHYIEDDCPLYTVCGTPTYVAPEILAETGYSYRVDVWALGIILYILLCGYPPFSSTTGEQADLFDLILVGDYEFPPEQWDGISEDAKDLIMKMIESDVDIRLTADEVLDHPWLCTNAEEAEAKRSTFFKSDFRFNVFEQMGLTKLGPCLGSSSTTESTSFETSNSS